MSDGRRHVAPPTEYDRSFTNPLRGLAPEPVTTSGRNETMLWTIIVILLILWLLGAFVRPFGGGFIHLLLVIVLILAILQLV